jgi:hypothetical protein
LEPRRRIFNLCWVGLKLNDYWFSNSRVVRLDQTTRIHGSIRDHGEDTWHELGRPQVHGYDVLDCAFLDALRFVSTSDEKVARVFEAPRAFITLTQALGVSITAIDEVKQIL